MHSTHLVHPGLASASQPGAGVGFRGRRSLVRKLGIRSSRRLGTRSATEVALFGISYSEFRDSFAQYHRTFILAFFGLYVGHDVVRRLALSFLSK